MRSEKEIIDRLKIHIAKVDGIMLAEKDKRIKKSFMKTMKEVYKEFEWILEGEPRYSVAELEKITIAYKKNEELFYLKNGKTHYIEQSAEYLIKTLKQDKKRVEAILND